MTHQVSFRTAEAYDLERTYEVMVRANEDLNRRLGGPVDVAARSPASRAMEVRRLLLRTDPERFWVAESGGLVVGFGMAEQRGEIWYLAALHVLPEAQAMGVGRGLLERMAGAGPVPRIRITIAESGNEASNGLYGRFGLFPQVPIIKLAGRPGAIGVPAGWEARDGSDLDPAVFAPIDRVVLGMRRDQDHACWAMMPGLRRLAVVRDRTVGGYAYVDRHGAIGPAAALDEAALVAAVGAAMTSGGLASRERVTIQVPGVSRTLLRTLLDTGFRYQAGVNLVLTSGPFGRLDRYVMSGADALF